MTDGFLASLVACRDIEETGGNVADIDKDVCEKSLRVKVCETREDRGAPVGPFSFEPGQFSVWGLPIVADTDDLDVIIVGHLLHNFDNARANSLGSIVMRIGRL